MRGPRASAWRTLKITSPPAEQQRCTGWLRSPSRSPPLRRCRLWEQKRLDLDAPVQKYCPSFPQKPWPITTREVMGHLGGIRHYKSGSQDDPEVGNTKHFDNPIEAGIQFFANDPLVSQPGTQFHYSTQGYTLVGCVVEGASGTNYVDFMRQNIFTPAGMDQTQADNRFSIIPYRTRFLPQDRLRRGVECRLSRLQLQDPGRRLAVLGRRYGALRGCHFE